MNPGDIFNTLLLAPTINLVVFIIRVLEAANIPGSLGFSIIVITILVTLVTWPFRNSQIKATKKMTDLKPHLDELKKKHRDKQALAQAQMALYKEHGVNPAGGCLPALIPILVLLPLYQVFLAFFEGQHGLERINYFLYNKQWMLTQLPDTHFFGVNLANKPSDFATVGVLILLIPLITAAFTFLQTKMMAPKQIKEYPSDSPKEKKEKESFEDATTAMQSQMTFMMPLMIGFFSWQFPVGLALYWNTLTLLGIFQQYRIAGWGGLEEWIKKIRR
jgi:YidC/Oxa1 family membrane protein insertase